MMSHFTPYHCLASGGGNRGGDNGMAGMAIAIPIISKNSVSKKLKLNKLSKLLKLSIICCHKFKLDY